MEYNNLSITELKKIAKDNNIKGISNKNKLDIIEVIQSYMNQKIQQVVKSNIIIEEDMNDLPDDLSDDLLDDNMIVCNNTCASKDLYEYNITYLKTVFNESLLNILQKKYTLDDSNNSKNIYHFINSYRDTIKIKYNLDNNFIDYTFIDRLTVNENIKVVWGNCLNLLKQMPSDSVGHMVTSPPYYNAREYSIWENLDSYMSNMREIIKECYRVLDNHRVFVFNISDVVDNDKNDKINAFGKRKIPLPAYFIVLFEECGFTFIDDIIWDKGEVQSSRHKNGNKPYPFFQYPCNCYEHILIFHKHQLEKDIRYPCNDCGSLNVKSNSYTSKGIRSWECRNEECAKSEANRGKRFSLKTITVQNPYLQENNIIPKELVADWRRDIHKLSPVIKINNKKENKLGHTAPFPSNIPEMSIQYYSYKGDIVLDMFAGSFTTAIAAKKLGRIGIGFELRKDLFKECIINNITSHDCSYEEIEIV